MHVTNVPDEPGQVRERLQILLVPAAVAPMAVQIGALIFLEVRLNVPLRLFVFDAMFHQIHLLLKLIVAAVPQALEHLRRNDFKIVKGATKTSNFLTWSMGVDAGLEHCSSSKRRALVSSFNFDAFSSHCCFSFEGRDFHSLPTILLMPPKVDSGLFWTICLRTSLEYKIYPVTTLFLLDFCQNRTTYESLYIYI